MSDQTHNHAAYCDTCDTVFCFEQRNVYDGAVFCPACMTRTLPENHAASLAEIRAAHPSATVYQRRERVLQD